MKNLGPDALGMLQTIETLSGRPVEFKPDSSLSLRATLQLARNGAPAHVLRYRPSNDPLDYWVAYQAGYLLRLLELPPPERFDFSGTGVAGDRVRLLADTRFTRKLTAIHMDRMQRPRTLRNRQQGVKSRLGKGTRHGNDNTVRQLFFWLWPCGRCSKGRSPSCCAHPGRWPAR